MPNRANNGPNTTIDALILETYLNGASYDNLPVASISTDFSFSSKPTLTFKNLITLFIVYTSDSIGTLVRIVLPSLGKIAAAKIGRTAFLAPSISTSPSNLFPPRTTIFSITIPHSALLN